MFYVTISCTQYVHIQYGLDSNAKQTRKLNHENGAEWGMNVEMHICMYEQVLK